MKINFIDLFAGCGGLSEGFSSLQSMRPIAHVEWEIPMVNTLRHRLISKFGYSEEDALKSVIHFDIQLTDELLEGKWCLESLNRYEKDNHPMIIDEGMNSLIPKDGVDIIIGGPPCQSYSIVGRAQDPNSMQSDYRNYLFESFAKVVSYYKPKLFVFENVPGLLSAKIGDKFILDEIYDAFDKVGYKIRERKDMKKSVYNANDFGVPQNRRRVIIFGVKKSSSIVLDDLYEELSSYKIKRDDLNVRNTISHLPKLFPLSESLKKSGKNISHISYNNVKVNHHEARYHNLRDIRIFQEWVEKEMNSLPTKKKLEYYKEKTGRKTNHNKYRNLNWDAPSPTIVAHLYKDGLMFIHPDPKQARSITIKEAALLQSFPDDFEFIGSNASVYKMIGNAVPVSFAKHIAKAVESVLKKEEK